MVVALSKPPPFQEEIGIANYIFERMRQLEINTVFGATSPKLYPIIDRINELPTMKWANNTNQLNASHAADGYSRVKSLAILVNEAGFGELSALNGIAGCYAEHVGLVHLVILPPANPNSNSNRLLLSHRNGDEDFSSFERVYSNISRTVVVLHPNKAAPFKVDTAIRDAYVNQMPVYIGLPEDVIDWKVNRIGLSHPIDFSTCPTLPEAETKLVDKISKIIASAKNPVILVDACVSRYQMQEEIRKIVDISQFPVFVTPMGKGGVDEQHPRFSGVYVGSISFPEVREAFENSDLVLCFGGILSNFHTSSFSFSYKTKNSIEFHLDFVKIKNSFHSGVNLHTMLKKLQIKIASFSSKYTPTAVVQKRSFKPSPFNSSRKSDITQEYLWSKLSNWLQPNDIIVAETGTSAFGIIQTHFPSGSLGITQAVWGTTGYTVGATFGACMALKDIATDVNRRVILFVGDGSLQFTVQEISNMVRWGLCPHIFVLNNEGFTIERLVHGLNAQYNDIQPWNNLDLLRIFNCQDYQTASVRTIEDLDNIFEDKEFSAPSKIRMVEVHLPKLDAPMNLVQHSVITSTWTEDTYENESD